MILVLKGLKESAADELSIRLAWHPAMNGSCPANFELETTEHGQRCRGESSWSCPDGCVPTGDPSTSAERVQTRSK